MAVDHRADVFPRLVAGREKENLLGQVSLAAEEVAFEIELEHVVLRNALLDRRPERQNEKRAARSTAAHVPPHVRELPAENLRRRLQLVFEVIDFTHRLCSKKNDLASRACGSCQEGIGTEPQRGSVP